MNSSVQGRVIKDRDDQLVVEVAKRSACQGCAKETGCTMSALGALNPSQSLHIAVSDMDLNVGETVELQCTHDGLVKAAFLAYGPGSLGLVIGASIAALNGFGDGGQALGALLGLSLGLSLTRMGARKGGLPTLKILKGAKR